jgi:virulence factor Mce-like protein
MLKSLAAKRLLGMGAILAGIAVLVLGVTQPNPLAETRSVWVELRSVQGLGATGRDVRLAGVNVGTIGEVRRDGDNALVELVLFEDVGIRRDARVEMRPHTLFEGSSFVDLHPGSPSAPPLGDEPIPREQTSNYVTLDEALRILRPEIRESLRELAGRGARTLRDEAIDGIQRSLRSAPALSRRSKGPARALQGAERRELERAIRGISRTVDAVADREDQLIPLTRRLNRTAAGLTVSDGAPLDAALATLPATLAELDAAAPELTALVDRLDRLGAEVAPALPDLAAAVREATPLLDRSIPVLRRAAPLVADLRVISGRIAVASPTLAELARRVGRMAETFGGSVLPVLHQRGRRGEPTYRQLLATFAAANAVWRPYQTIEQNPNGAGHLWNLGTYVDFEGGLEGGLGGFEGGPASLSCGDVGEISRSAASTLRARGYCR